MVEQLLFTTCYRRRATANTEIPIIVDAADGRIVAERFCEVKKKSIGIRRRLGQNPSQLVDLSRRFTQMNAGLILTLTIYWVPV
ncbi:MAG: hypothetical protein DMF69_15575 [Acidobacteria bacterium]|nr:MAG: hypothetical protein DMF69_15575 [Acidobacteriota bacterium]